MEDRELEKLFNPTLKIRETMLFFLIVVINGLIYIDLDIGLNTAQGGGAYILKNREVLGKEVCSFWWSSQPRG